MTTPLEAWQERADALAAFYRLHQRWPSPNTSDPVETALHRWHSAARRTAYNSYRPSSDLADRIGYLDRVAPGWRHHDRIFRDRIDAIARYRQQRGVFPSQDSPDPEIARLGDRLRDCRTTPQSPTRQAYLDDTLPGWQQTLREQLWNATADAVEAFIREHHRLPQAARNDPVERRLAKWIRNQQTRTNHTPAQTTRLEALTQLNIRAFRGR